MRGLLSPRLLGAHRDELQEAVLIRAGLSGPRCPCQTDKTDVQRKRHPLPGRRARAYGFLIPQEEKIETHTYFSRRSWHSPNNHNTYARSSHWLRGRQSVFIFFSRRAKYVEKLKRTCSDHPRMPLYLQENTHA